MVGAVVCEKRGPVAYRARVCIDATGDGDLAFAAGCAFEQGREEDGLHMPITLGFSLGGVDCDRFFEWYGDEKRPEFLNMLPRGVDGLLVAGRCGSATFLGHCAGKSMGNMMEIGIAAGTAVAMCAQRGETPRQLNIDDLRHALIEEMKVSL